MKLGVRNNKDFWAGMMFFWTGVGAMFAPEHYPFGTTLSMGPGYFPMVLGGMLIVFGVCIMLRGLRKNEKVAGPWPLRSLILLPLSVVVFGILMNVAGLVPALVALVFLSAASGQEFKFKEVLVLTVISVRAFGSHVSSGASVCHIP